MATKNKIFVRTLASLLVAYFAFNLVVWHFFTGPLLRDSVSAGGDLSRLGYLSGSKMFRQNAYDLPSRHLEVKEYRGQRIDVLTIGDSFSVGGGGGKNPYYQDYLSSINDLTVLNIPQLEKMNKIETVSILNNNGYLDRMKPKHVVVEFSEKLCFADLPDSIDFSRSIPEKEFERYERVGYGQAPSPQAEKLIELNFFSDANFKLVKNMVGYRFSDNAWGSQVYKAKLDREFFSVEDADVLLFYFKDIKRRQGFTSGNISKLNGYLNTLSDRLAAKGIKLYFMPCVDKYNLYSSFIVNNRHPKSNFFEELRALPKRYTFIDTKAILLEELRNGTKDLFYADDSHWSWKASKKVFETVRFR